MIIKYLPVQGTWEAKSDAGDWTKHDSPLSRFLLAYDLENLNGAASLPFTWSTGLNFQRGDHSAWEAGGHALFYYLVPPLRPDAAFPPAETVVVTHSHGLQVALYAAFHGLKIDRLVDLMGPVRGDMDTVAAVARRNIRRWLHVRSDHTDLWQIAGELGDEHLGIVRDHPLADVNCCVPGVGHSGVIRDPRFFHLWLDRGWVDLMKGAQ